MKHVIKNTHYRKSTNEPNINFMSSINIYDIVIFSVDGSNDTIQSGVISGITKKGLHITTHYGEIFRIYCHIKEVYKRKMDFNNNQDISTIFLNNMMKTISDINNIKFDSIREFIDYCKQTYDTNKK